MDTSRRQFLRATALGAGALAFSPSLDPLAAASREMGPRRFIFIRKSSGIRPLETALLDFSDREKKLDQDKQPLEVALDKRELPVWLRGLDQYKSQMMLLGP